MGMAAITSGTASTITVGERITPMSEITPSMAPSMSEPESPMKMLAGVKLNRRKASVAPKRITDSMAVSPRSRPKAIKNKKNAAIAAMPAAKPSKPSIKFITFMKHTRYSTVSG